MITKEKLRETNSNFYKSPSFTEEPIKHIITDEDIYDPGRVTHIYDLPFNTWPLILRYNQIIDPIDDLEEGTILLIPTLKDLKKLELED